jgi:hypothetical protein
MTRRIRKAILAVAALAALALGGAAFAQAQSSPGGAHEHVSKTDRDNVRSGDQKAPDKARASSADPVGGGTGQSGDQSTPDTVSANDSPSAENPKTGADSESTTANDGPGGHADEPGRASADHRFQGNE